MKKYLIFGNAESVHLLKWVKELVKYFEVFIISSKGVHPEIAALIQKDHLNILDLYIGPTGGNYKILEKYFNVKNLIKTIEPDFVNPHYVTSHGFLIALIKNFSNFPFRLIQTTWGTDILVTPFKNKLYYNLTKFSLDKANLITSDSEYMTSVIKTISGSETMTFSFGLDELPDISLDTKDVNLFYSNRMLTENYNIKGVIDLFNLIVQSNPNALLIISHDGEQRKYLEDYSKQIGLENKITFVGFISLEEQIRLYREAQFYLSLPVSDSTSVSLIEAMAYGCIPVLSDIPANHEWIKDGVNGIIFRKEDFNLSKFLEFSSNNITIARTNRKIIEERGIFPESIKHFVEKINQILS
jgi:glycosyltransferase involved in cell wall biosynthesis